MDFEEYRDTESLIRVAAAELESAAERLFVRAAWVAVFAASTAAGRDILSAAKAADVATDEYQKRFPP